MMDLIDTKTFGLRVREIREKCGFTRKQIEINIGISTETLRKIEKGEALPRISTMQLLSRIYNFDIIKMLNDIKNGNILDNRNQIIDKLLTSNPKHCQALDSLIITDSELDFSDKLLFDDIKQFNAIVRCLPLSNSNDSSKKREAIKKLFSSLEKFDREVNINSFDRFSYTYLELRILFIIGVTYAELGTYKTSSKIFNFLKDYITFGPYLSHSCTKLYIKLLCNIAFNQHIENLHIEVIKTCNYAIALCNDIESSYLLEVMLYRKAIAQYLLEDKLFKNTLVQCKKILEIKKLDDQIETYTKSTFKYYGIQF